MCGRIVEPARQETNQVPPRGGTFCKLFFYFFYLLIENRFLVIFYSYRDH
jgi:hypothetical protein